MALNITPAPTGEAVDSFAYQQWMLTLGQLLSGSSFDEATQDAIGGILVDSSVIDFTYDDTVPSITATVKTDSINDTHIDWGTGANQVSTTDMPEGTNLYYTDERAQDAVGGMVDTSLVYVDATPLLTRAALSGDISASQGSNTTTLATVNLNVGTFGSSSQVAQVTVNGKGLTTAAANVTIDHGSINGLADDDHTQYLLVAGTRALSADWDAGSFEIRAQTFESDVATGTAPLVIASTTKVTNLNADLLDDQSGAYYLDSANFTGTNWTDLTDGGGTTLHTHSATGVTNFYALIAARVSLGT